MRAGLLGDRWQSLQQLPGPFAVGCKNLLVGLVLALALALVVKTIVVVVGLSLEGGQGEGTETRAFAPW